MVSFYSADNQGLILNEEAQGHLAAHPDVIALLPEVTLQLNLKNDGSNRIVKEINLGRVIGTTGLIKTELVSLNQKVLFAYRKAREFPSRVVRERGIPCDTVTISAYFNETSNQWVLLTAYIGYICPDEPFYFSDRESIEFTEALNFWSTHALAYDEQAMGEPFESSWQEELGNQILKERKLAWIPPDLEKERGEIERVIKDFLNKESDEQTVKEITKIIHNSPMSELSESDWEKLENTDSFHGVRPGHLEDAQRRCETYNEKLEEENKRDFNKLLHGFESGDSMECPVIIRNSEGRLHLVSGNTRLMISRTLEIRPKVIIANVA